MNITLSPKAKEYLKQSGCKEIVVEEVEIQNCCIPVTAPPSVHKGSPQNPMKFTRLDIEGYSIYIEKTLMRVPHLVIDIKGFGFMKTLSVTNWDIKF